MHDYSDARRNMVLTQLLPNRVTDDRVLDAMGTVPRERFVPVSHRAVAYVDEDVAIGYGRFLMEPMLFARLLQAADIRSHEAVLDIGCGAGYSAAVLARLASAVVAVEEQTELAEQAGELIEQLGVQNAAVITGPLAEGYAAQAPYDVIVVEGALEVEPKALLDQLADGGRLVAVMNDKGRVGHATLFTNYAGAIARRTLFDAATPVLSAFRKTVGFVF
ncbi:protein-L-isoaspartate O-methyltransferase [Tistrella bauzanensis]|uniref:Protein-L-isoaspartate O-methyltransferase n=1 Tax=Tistrella bauzanensis TaxID=657419 RepID=A0ABQ1I9V8_9PROT|nr:protein-L-isoaspartate O-methyltransferase [Tistrella bauzanensis]GGB26847.1 protein-L-isoaspartate O-methyltransferase [Tistrella bauzanensis]